GHDARPPAVGQARAPERLDRDPRLAARAAARLVPFEDAVEAREVEHVLADGQARVAVAAARAAQRQRAALRAASPRAGISSRLRRLALTRSGGGRGRKGSSG